MKNPKTRTTKTEIFDNASENRIINEILERIAHLEYYNFVQEERKKKVFIGSDELKKENRYCLKEDNHGRWFMIEEKDKEKFFNMLKTDITCSEFYDLCDYFEDNRIYGPQAITFSNPKEE